MGFFHRWLGATSNPHPTDGFRASGLGLHRQTRDFDVKVAVDVVPWGSHTWMSQEVGKWLGNGLQPTYKWDILGL